MKLHVGIVHAAGDICHVAAAPSASCLADRLAAYVEGQLEYQLWPGDADRVRSLLSRGETAEALSHYFSNTGRWDPERLTTRCIEVPKPWE